MATIPTEGQLKALRAAQKLEQGRSAVIPREAAERCEDLGWLEAQSQGGYLLTELGRRVLRRSTGEATGGAVERYATAPITATKVQEADKVIELDVAGRTVPVIVTPDAGQIGITSDAPTVVVSDPGRLLDPGTVSVTAVRDQHTASKQMLEDLREKLDEFHGGDAPDIDTARNTQEVPLSESELQLLRAVVDSAIALHRAPSLPKRIVEAIKSIYEFLIDMKRRLDGLSDTVDSLKVLAFKIGEAALAIKELLDILGVTF